MDPVLLANIVAFLNASAVDGAIVARLQGVLRGKTTPQGQAFYDNRVQLLAYIQSYPAEQFFNKFIDLMNFLGTDYGALNSPALRAAWLIRLNTLFPGLNLTHAKSLAADIPPLRVIQVFAEIEDGGIDTHASFTQYVTVHGAGACLNLFRVLTAWATGGKPSGDLYLLIQLLHTNAVPLHALTPACCLDLRKLYALCPQTRRFPGFASWGSGDGGDIATNVENHFKKHVLNARPTALTNTAECAVWWNKLGIVLSTAEMAGVPDSPQKVLAMAMFNPGGQLPAGRVVDFLAQMRAELMRVGSPLMTWFVERFKVKYKDTTLSFSTNMASVAVFMERGQLYISGRKTDSGSEFYIVGRIDDGVITISACYVATDIATKLAERDVLWTCA